MRASSVARLQARLRRGDAHAGPGANRRLTPARPSRVRGHDKASAVRPGGGGLVEHTRHCVTPASALAGAPLSHPGL